MLHQSKTLVSIVMSEGFVKISRDMLAPKEGPLHPHHPSIFSSKNGLETEDLFQLTDAKIQLIELLSSATNRFCKAAAVLQSS